MIVKPIEWGFTMDATTRALRFGYGLPATGPLAAPFGPAWGGMNQADTEFGASAQQPPIDVGRAVIDIYPGGNTA